MSKNNLSNEQIGLIVKLFDKAYETCTAAIIGFYIQFKETPVLCNSENDDGQGAH